LSDVLKSCPKSPKTIKPQRAQIKKEIIKYKYDTLSSHFYSASSVVILKSHAKK